MVWFGRTLQLPPPILQQRHPLRIRLALCLPPTPLHQLPVLPLRNRLVVLPGNPAQHAREPAVSTGPVRPNQKVLQVHVLWVLGIDQRARECSSAAFRVLHRHPGLPAAKIQLNNYPALCAPELPASILYSGSDDLLQHSRCDLLPF